jgi:hypothetical protein
VEGRQTTTKSIAEHGTATSSKLQQRPGEHGISRVVGGELSKRDESQGSSDITGTINPAAVLSVAASFGRVAKLLSEQTQEVC